MTDAPVIKRAANRGSFRKGATGNPKGRPRKQPSAPSSVFDIVVDRTLTVIRNGAEREITIEEALQHKTYQEAIAGKRMAQRQILKWIEKREAWLAENGPKAPARPITFLTRFLPADANEALALLELVRPDPDRQDLGMDRAQLLLEPWGVLAALKRGRRRSALTKQELATIKRCTRDAHTLPLPQGVRE